MDMFESKALLPMLIAKATAPFSDPEWLYELKLDGERCLAYLDETGAVLTGTRGKRLLPFFPELGKIHTQVKRRCILDGELIIYTTEGYDFKEVMRRSLQTNQLRRERDARRLPASFVAFDILYLDGRDITGLPLAQRKQLLEETVQESPRLSLSRFIEEQGVEMFRLTVQQNLEGVVAKRKNSLYTPGKRTGNWVKFKNLLDDEYIICGYIKSSKAAVAKLVLGQYNTKGHIVYKGHVVLALSSEDFALIKGQPLAKRPPFALPPPSTNKGAVWVKPTLVCSVHFADYTPTGKMRQPQYKGLRLEKDAGEVVEPEWSIRF